MYLKYDSAHPQRCKDSIPYSQFLRICTKNSDFIQHTNNYTTFFQKRGYPKKLLDEALALAASKDRNSLLSYRPKDNTDKDKVFLIQTYHPHKQIHQNWPILGRNNTTEFLYNKKLVCGYRRPKNVRDILTKAKVSFLKGDELADPTYNPLIPVSTNKNPSQMFSRLPPIRPQHLP